MNKSIKHFITGILITCISFLISFIIAIFECLTLENDFTHFLFNLFCFGVLFGIFYIIFVLFYCLYKDLKQIYYEK